VAVWLLGRASLRGHQLIQERLAQAGVRKWHYGVLATLVEFGPAAQAQVGRRLGLDRSDLVAVLNDLEHEGYVSRSPDPIDRRRNTVTVTDAGHTALKRFDGLVVEANDRLLEPLSPAERELLASLLARLAHPSS
jgi:DNA-binding MarR family transcriptional regulator